jgi:hypothetical protein
MLRSRLETLEERRIRIEAEIDEIKHLLGITRLRRSDPAPCGSEQGYQRHHYRGEKCDECKRAHAAYERSRRAKREAS